MRTLFTSFGCCVFVGNTRKFGNPKLAGIEVVTVYEVSDIVLLIAPHPYDEIAASKLFSMLEIKL